MTESTERKGRVDCGECPSMAGCNAGHCMHRERFAAEAAARAAAPQAQPERPPAGKTCAVCGDVSSAPQLVKCCAHAECPGWKEAGSDGVASQAQPAPAEPIGTALDHLRNSIAWMLRGEKAGPCIGVADMQTILAALEARSLEPAPISDERIEQLWDEANKPAPRGHMPYTTRPYYRFARALLAERGTPPLPVPNPMCAWPFPEKKE